MPDDVTRREDWAEYRRLVLSELESLHEQHARLRDAFDAFKERQIKEMTALKQTTKTTSLIWGALAASVPVAVAIVWEILRH